MSASQATEDQIKLLRMQRRLQDDLDKPYVDYSLHDTVYGLILDGNHKRAEQLYREFRIPDKRSVGRAGGRCSQEAFWHQMSRSKHMRLIRKAPGQRLGQESG